jgi:hypothetical protein
MAFTLPFVKRLNAMKPAKAIVQNLLSYADIDINGPNAWDMQVHDERLYGRILKDGSLAWAKLIWMAGGIALNLMNALPGFSLPILMKRLPAIGRHFF